MASSTSTDDNISGENEQHEQVQRQEKTPEYVYHTPQTYRLSHLPQSPIFNFCNQHQVLFNNQIYQTRMVPEMATIQLMLD